MRASSRSMGRRCRIVVAALLAATLVAFAAPAPLWASPGGPDGTDNAALQAALDAATRGYNDAKGRLDVAQRRQAELTQQLQATQAQVDALSAEVNAAVVTAYKGGRISSLAVLLDSSSVPDFLDRATRLSAQLRQDGRTLRALHEAQDRYSQ